VRLTSWGGRPTPQGTLSSGTARSFQGFAPAKSGWMPNKRHMKNPKDSSVQNSSEIQAELLRENARILLLPSGVVGRKDSNYELYLDCSQPESAICLSNHGVGISDGCNEVELVVRQGNRLVFVRESHRPAVGKVKRLLDQLHENLDNHPTRRAAIDFVGWLHAERPTSMDAIVRYFLAKPECWLIGLPTGTVSQGLFTQRPVRSGAEAGVQWHRLVDLRMESRLALATAHVHVPERRNFNRKVTIFS
jgi:hypothetical protein